MKEFIELTYFEGDLGLPDEYQKIKTKLFRIVDIKVIEKTHYGKFFKGKPNCEITFIDGNCILPQESYEEVKLLIENTY